MADFMNGAPALTGWSNTWLNNQMSTAMLGFNKQALQGANFATRMLFMSNVRSGNPTAVSKFISLTKANTNLYSTNPTSSTPQSGKITPTDLNNISENEEGTKSGGGLGGLTKVLGAGLSSINSVMPTMDKDVNDTDAGIRKAREGVESGLLNSENPWAMAAGAGLMLIDKTGGFSDASEGLGKGNDIGNSIASALIPGLGWFLGKTKNYKISEELEKSGASYGGTLTLSKTAAKNSGAKLLFGRGKADRILDLQILEDGKVQNIVQEAQRNMLVANNPAINLGTQLAVNGGYLLADTVIGKKGLKFDGNFLQKVNKYKKGKPVKKPEVLKEVVITPESGTYTKFWETLPDNLKNTPEDDYRMYRLWELSGEPNNFEDAKELFNFNESDNSWHAPSIAYNEKTGEYEFMKPKHHDTLYMEVDNYEKGISYDDDGIPRKHNKEELEWWDDFRNHYELVKDGDFYRYIPRQGIEPKKFAKGGSFNVIPDGALHKNKHHLEDIDEKFEDVTNKGIPVVTEDAKGEITQHAEVEINEIIFRLEVTLKLEKLMNTYTHYTNSLKEKDNAAIEAGKLLVKEILENTIDNTGLIEEIN